MKYCINCEKELSTDAVFCQHCGSKQPVEASVETTPSPTKKSKRGLKIACVVRNSAMLMLAILLLITSFLPTTTVDLEEHENILGTENIDQEFGLNTFQYITLFVDSFKDVESYDELFELEEKYEKLSDSLDKMEDKNFENLTPREKNIVNKALFLMIRSSVQHDQGGPYVYITLCAAFGIVNIILSLSLFIVALLNLLATFDIVIRGKASLYKWTVGLLTASPAVILATHYAGRFYIGGGLSSMAISSIICTVAVVIMTMIVRYAFSKKDTSRNITARSVALALALIVFFLAFAPVFSVTVAQTEQDAEYYRPAKISHKASFFEVLMIDQEESKLFEKFSHMSDKDREEYFADTLESFSLYSRQELEGDLGTSVSTNLLFELSGAMFLPPVLNLFSATLVFFIIAVICALIVLWQCLYFFATGRHVQPIVTISKKISAVAALLALVATITFVALTDWISSLYIGSDLRVSISAGVIIFTIFAFGAAFCPAKLTEKARKPRPARIKRPLEEFEAQF